MEVSTVPFNPPPPLQSNPPAQTGRSTKLWPTSCLFSVWTEDGVEGGRKMQRPQTQWASASRWPCLLIIWISKAYLDNTSFECQIAGGSWGRLEDACMWKHHTGLIVIYTTLKIQRKTHTHAVYLMLWTWFHFSADQSQDIPCPSSFYP